MATGKKHDPGRAAREMGAPGSESGSRPRYRKPRREDPPSPEELATSALDVPEAVEAWRRARAAVEAATEQAGEEGLRLEALDASGYAEDYLPGVQAERLRALLAERARRRSEGLAIYEPLPVQAGFHASKARMRIIRGSNRSGKTIAAAVEVARAACGCDPFGKYPKTDGRIFCVGKDLGHVGEVMWRKLARSGQFKMIRDEVSGYWRAFRPWDPRDQARASEAKGAPPLIPRRMISKIAWEHKAESIPSVVRLTNGWELSFYSSLGKPPQGSDIDLFWLDEEIVDPEWYPEMSARVVDRRGRGLWSATPQAGTDQLYDLHEVAEKERHLERPSVEEFVALLQDNLHFAEEDKKAYAATLSEDDYRVRVQGEFALTAMKVYPEFSMVRHGEEWREIPPEWTRYAAIDPGHRVCAVLFAAVPPPEEGDHLWLYDELYLQQCDAMMFGEAMRARLMGQQLQAMVIDPHMDKFTEIGGGRTVGDQYEEALRANGVRCVTTGSGFTPGCDDVKAGILAVHGLLRSGAMGSKPKLRVLQGALPNFEYEIRRYHNKRVAGVLQDAPDNRKASHLLDDLRYLALYDPRWVKPVVGKSRPGPAIRALREKRKRKREAGGGEFIRLGPGGTRRI